MDYKLIEKVTLCNLTWDNFSGTGSMYIFWLFAFYIWTAALGVGLACSCFFLLFNEQNSALLGLVCVSMSPRGPLCTHIIVHGCSSIIKFPLTLSIIFFSSFFSFFFFLPYLVPPYQSQSRAPIQKIRQPPRSQARKRLQSLEISRSRTPPQRWDPILCPTLHGKSSISTWGCSRQRPPITVYRWWSISSSPT